MIGCWLLLIPFLPSVPRHGRLPPTQGTPTAAPNQLSGMSLLRIGEIHDQQEHFPGDLDLLSAGAGEIPGKTTSGHRHGFDEDRTGAGASGQTPGGLRFRYRKPCRCSPKPGSIGPHAKLLATGRGGATGQRDASRDALTQATALFTRVRNARDGTTMVQLGLLPGRGR